MYKEQRITTVVPAYNEARHIRQVLSGLPDFVDVIVVVDDGSTDDTREIASAYSDTRLIVLQTPVNLGVGGAVILGYRKAIELGSDIVVKMDGDGQMPSEYLHVLLDALIDLGYDYAKGNRFLSGDSLSQMPGSRLWGNIMLTFLTKLASGYWHIFAPQNGYTAIKSEALQALDLDAIHSRYFFENDVLVNLNVRSLRVKDVSIPARYGDEESNISIIDIGLSFPFLLTGRFFRRLYQKYVLRDFSPIALFLFLGLALLLWGVAFGAYEWVTSSVSGHPSPH